MVKNLLLKIEPDLDMRINVLTAHNNKIKRKYCIELLTEIVTQKETELSRPTSAKIETGTTINYSQQEERIN